MRNISAGKLVNMLRNILFAFSSSAAFLSSAAIAQNLTGHYWNPTESGWGLTIDEQNGTCVVAVYTFTSARKPIWYVFSGNCAGGTLEATTYTGKGGTSWKKAFVQGSSTPREAGTGKIVMDRATRKGTLVATFDGVTATKPIEELKFGQASVLYSRTFSGHLWGGSAQSGWGMQLTQQGSIAVSVLYSFDDTGNPVWMISVLDLVAGTGVRDGSPANGSVSAFQNRPEGWLMVSGPPWGTPYAAQTITAVSAATGDMQFSATGMRMTIGPLTEDPVRLQPIEYFAFGPAESARPNTELLFTSPSHQELVRPDAAIWAVFSGTLNSTTVTNQTVRLFRGADVVPATVAIDTSYGVVSIRPSQSLQPSSQYSIVFSGIRDTFGFRVPDQTRNFSTSDGALPLKYAGTVLSLWAGGKYPNIVSTQGARRVKNMSPFYRGAIPLFSCVIADKPLTDGRVLANCQAQAATDNVPVNERVLLYIDPVLGQLYRYNNNVQIFDATCGWCNFNALDVPAGVVWRDVDPADFSKQWGANVKIPGGWLYTTAVEHWTLRFLDDFGVSKIVRKGRFDLEGSINTLQLYSNP